MAYFELQPFGQDFSDMQMAQVACLLANIHRKPNSQPHDLREFLPDMGPKQTPEQMKMILRGVLGGYRKEH